MATAEKIPLEPVASSNISALGYNPTKKILAIQFKAGSIFHYTDVEPEVAAGFATPDGSVGRYYAEHIKGKFHGARMTGPCAKCEAEGWVGERCEDCGTADYQAKPYPKEDHTDGQGSNGAPVPVQEQNPAPHRVSQQGRRRGARTPPRPARQAGKGQ